MNERRQDFELLRRFARQGEQSAFADVVRRHVNLVFGTALRKVEDPGAAQEVAQNVFAALARKAWRFAPDDSLPAWLHKAALLESKSWLRGELRRRRREETAAELGTTMNTPEDQPAFQALVPLLDEALLSLREKDRTALLLCFYESHSLREVGTAVGVSEDAARMRVQSALAKVAEFFKRRGFKTASVAVATAALEHTATTASATVVSRVVSAALQVAPPALVGLGVLLARLASLTKVQKAAVSVALVAALLFWLWRDQRPARQGPRRIATQLAAGRNDATNLQTKVERNTAEPARQAQPAPQAKEIVARPAAGDPNPPQAVGAVMVWGDNTKGQLNVPVEAQSGVIAVAAGTYHIAALKNDGSVLQWGGYVRDIPSATNVPVTAQSGVVAIAAASSHTLALKRDGTVVAWGYFAQTNVPAAAQTGVKAIAAGTTALDLALKDDGSVVAWKPGPTNAPGGWAMFQREVPVAARRGVTAIAAGSCHALALKNDGSVVAWAYCDTGYSATNVPVAAQSGVTAIAAAEYCSLALKQDGSVVAWGIDPIGTGLTNVPAAARSGVKAISAGIAHAVALKNDGTVVAWGANTGLLGAETVDRQLPLLSGMRGVTAVSAGLWNTVMTRELRVNETVSLPFNPILTNQRPARPSTNRAPVSVVR